MSNSLSHLLRPTLLACLALLTLTPAASAQQEQVFFFKVFLPDTIGPGSVSTLLFELSSSEDGPVTDLAFTDALPAGVVIATPPNASTTCGAGAFVDAPAGGSTITFTGGQLPPTPEGDEGVDCLVLVDVTSSTPGTHTNVSGDLTSSLGNHGDATADLTVTTARPGFTKSFAPSPITVGQTSTLTLTIDNSANASAAFGLSFIDNLPAGLVVASPANGATTCSGSLTASPGAGSISFNFGTVAAGSSCTVTVEVVASLAGSLGNTTGELSSNLGSSGKASAVLQVALDSLVKAFTDDPVAPGGTVTLQFTVTNFDRDEAATDLAFTDDLDAALSGLEAVPPLPAAPCGAGSTLTGTSVLTLTGGSLPPEGSCTFAVTLQVPAGAAPGSYTNTTSPLTATVGGAPVVLNAASDDLVVTAEPVLAKEFLDDPVIPGGTVTLEFTITNTSTTDSATGITFFDELTTLLPGTTALGLPAGACGGTLVQRSNFPVSGVTSLFLGTGAGSAPGNLGPAGSCTFTVTLQIPTGASGGIYTNTTSVVTATVDGETLTGDPASDDLVVVAAPRLQKLFTDDPVPAGDTVTLQLTLQHGAEAAGEATGISFTDDLDAALSGLVALGPLPATPCGPGSTLSGTNELTLSGGSLAPGESCTFSVTLQVPAGAPSGNHLNTTGTVQATVEGLATESAPATDLLSVAALRLTKSFLDDPVLPGATVTLQLTVQNLSPSSSATDITFTDDLTGVLAGLVATDLPKANVCGLGSTLSASGGGTVLSLSGGSLAPGGTCTFDTVLQVPAGAASDTYSNVTAGFSATIEAETVAFPNASDQLTVDDNLLVFSKEFLDDPVAPGGPVTLRFTIQSLASETVTDLTFTDDLDDALMGLASVSGTLPDVCGAGSQLSGTSLLTLTGGTLAAGASCAFDVALQVPGAAPLGTDAVNTTSLATGTVGGLEVTGGPATDTLQIDAITFAKSFDGPTAAGGNPVLTFTIVNLDAGSAASQLAFLDDLGAVVPGLVAVAPLPANPCGAGSSLSGTSVLALSGGSLAAAGQPGDSCSFAVTLQVPADAAAGSFLNTTGQLFSEAIAVADPATDTLAVEPPPAFGKSFAPDSVSVGQTSTLTFTIVNLASAVAATGLDFTDTLPAGIVVASPPNASTTCTGGTITAVAGGGTIAYTGGSVAASASCAVQVDVTAIAPGAHLNTSGVLTSSSGSSGTASDLLTASPVVNLLEIPTLAEWGLALLAGLMLAAGLWRLRG
jgi:uncharacterized repeat protein (TIGR01451 family)